MTYDTLVGQINAYHLENGATWRSILQDGAKGSLHSWGGVLDTNFDRGARLEILDPDPVPESFAPENMENYRQTIAKLTKCK